jgi:catechol 2,3-dioxygenase-like lactoylglutathione lyase family enzyme
MRHPCRVRRSAASLPEVHWRRGDAVAGVARVIALLRSMDMPVSEIRRILAGADEAERRQILRDHRGRLEARLGEVRCLLAAVDAVTEEDDVGHDARTDVSAWLHVMPRLPVSDLERPIAYYEEALGFRLAWRTAEPVSPLWLAAGSRCSSWCPGRRGRRLRLGSVCIRRGPRRPLRGIPRGRSGCHRSGCFPPLWDAPFRGTGSRRPPVHARQGEDRLRDVAGYFGLSSEEITVDPHGSAAGRQADGKLATGTRSPHPPERARRRGQPHSRRGRGDGLDGYLPTCVAARFAGLRADRAHEGCSRVIPGRT